MMRLYFGFFCTLLLASFIHTYVEAQEMYRILHLEVIDNETPLRNAWAGGLNNPQFSAADLNNDGIEDLVIFDRADNHFLTFINGGQIDSVDYTYNPVYENNFPITSSWSLLLDYNCDEIPDLFTAYDDGIKTYLGHYDSNSHLSFTEDVSKLNYDNAVEDIEIAPYDLPAIADINGDGHIDILTFDPSGGYIFYFMNQASDCGDLDFVLDTECWGAVYETGIEQGLELDSDCGEGKTETENLHPGSTLLATDLDGDNLSELVLGDINFDNLVCLYNDGTADEAHIHQQDTEFPGYDSPVNIRSFPASFMLDVNNDGLMDLLAAPNSASSLEPYRCSWGYENVGSPTEAIFNFRSDLFLVEQMIEYGEGAHPAFFDYNVDGLTDLLIGNNFSYEHGENKVASLSLYENIGTSTQPTYELITHDYLNFSAQGFLGLVPTFGDLNGDGAIDMMLGTAGPTVPVPGGDFNGVLIYFENQAASDETVDYSAFPAYKYQDIDVGQSSAPQLVDVNGDDVLDLLIGEGLGIIEYWENIGDAQNPQFSLVNDFWGQVDVRDSNLGNGMGFSVPQLMRWNEGDEWTLLVGSVNGQIYQYSGIEENISSGAFAVVNASFNDIQDGHRSSPAFADLNNDNGWELLVGNIRGGISLYSSEPDIYTAIDDIPAAIIDWELYPNPVDQFLIITSSQSTQNKIEELSLYSASGELLWTQSIHNGNQAPIQLSTQNWANGLYILRIAGEKSTLHQKILVRH